MLSSVQVNNATGWEQFAMQRRDLWKPIDDEGITNFVYKLRQDADIASAPALDEKRIDLDGREVDLAHSEIDDAVDLDDADEEEEDDDAYRFGSYNFMFDKTPALSEPAPTAKAPQLFPYDSKQLMQITASRLKKSGPTTTVPYRRPNPLTELKIQLSNNSAALKKLALGLVLFAGVAVFMNHQPMHMNVLDQTSAVKADVQTTKAAARPAAPHILVAKRHIEAPVVPVTHAAIAHRSFSATKPTSSEKSAPPVAAVVQPVGEYKGPSSVTGVQPAHRRAYQTASIAVHPLQ